MEDGKTFSEDLKRVKALIITFYELIELKIIF